MAHRRRGGVVGVIGEEQLPSPVAGQTAGAWWLRDIELHLSADVADVPRSIAVAFRSRARGLADVVYVPPVVTLRL
jgi:hypothetical protein